MEIALAILGILAVVIPLVVKLWMKRHEKQDAVVRTEADELAAGMDRVDRLFPDPRDK